MSHQTASLSQLKNPGDTIAEIAGEALKVIQDVKALHSRACFECPLILFYFKF
jgi:hypothetical protein